MVNKDRIIAEFIEMVSVPCPSKGEREEAELIMSKLRALGLEPVMDEAHLKTGGNCGNVWVYIKGNVPTAPVLFFEAHMDSVAPATGTHVVRRDGVLYSDGTTTLGGDDKVGVASMLEAVRALQEDNLPHGDLQLCFTISEEIGCLGVVNMDKSWIKADFGYCLDADGEIGGITYAAPKLYDIDVTITGKAAHAGMEPEKGINAIMLAAAAISKLPTYGRIDAETTMNIGIFQAGQGKNIVCPEAKFTIDMRSLDVAKLEKLKDDTLVLLEQEVVAQGGQFAYEITDSCPAVCVPQDHACIQLAERAAKSIGRKPQLLTSGGCSDGNFLCGYDLPCAVLATGMSNIHTTSEFLKEDDLYATAQWMYAIIKEAAAQ